MKCPKCGSVMIRMPVQSDCEKGCKVEYRDVCTSCGYIIQGEIN